MTEELFLWMFVSEEKNEREKLCVGLCTCDA